MCSPSIVESGKIRVIEAIESISEELLQRAWQEIVHRLIITVTIEVHTDVVMWISKFVEFLFRINLVVRFYL